MLNAILKFSIEHRWLVVLLTVMVAAIGIWSLTVLPIDAVPDITNNQVQINTVYPALSPTEVETQITFPIETALAGIEGLDYTRSLSRNGFSQVQAIFYDGVDIYYARQQVLERLGAVEDRLPPGADPEMGPISTGLGEIFMYTVEYEHPHGRGAETKDGEPGWQSDGTYLTPEGRRLETPFEQTVYLRTVQDWIIAWQLRNVEGVAGVDTIGGYQKQVHIQPDPDLLASHGLTFHDVIQALERNNQSTGAGYIEHKGEYYTVRAAGLIESQEQIESIPIGTHEGTPIHIHDVATVRLGKELRTGSASENGEEVVVGTALMRIGENSRTVAANVAEKMAEINKTLPPDVRAKTVLDRTRLVDATIATVESNLFEGAVLVIVVLFVLLGNFRAALLTACAIPLAMLMAATGMVQTGISGNLMSLGAIDFGLIVDGSVIIVENCIRRLAEKQKELGRELTTAERLKTVFAGSAQVRSATAFGETIITIVYIPILFLTGIEGKMFRPMAATVIFALASAFVLSLTFVPAMVAIAIRGRVEEKENVLIRWAKSGYEPILRWAVRGRVVVVAGAVVIFGLSLWLFSSLGQEFVPTLDEGDIALQAIRIPSTSLSQSQKMQFALERTVAEFDEVAFVFSKTGTAEVASDPMPPNISDTFIILKPREEWPDPDRTKEDLIARLEEKVKKLPGNDYEFTQPIEMRFNELISGVRSDIAVKVFGEDFDQLRRTAHEIAGLLRDIPGSANVKVEQTSGLPLMEVDIDRGVLARYGLHMSDIQEVVSIAVGGRNAGLLYQGDRRFSIVVRLPEAIRTEREALENLRIPLPDSRHVDGESLVTGQDDTRFPGNPAGHRSAFISLGDVATIRVTEGPNQISRENGKRRVTVGANVRERDIGSFVAEAQQRIDEAITLPAGASLDWGGQFENLRKAKQRLSIVVPVCFLLIFLLLFSTFGRVRQALMVFTGVPLALTGGIAALWLRGMPFSISAAVGFIALSGVAVLNGLVLITFINELKEKGEALQDAIVTGARTRLRPVLMTALVASLGFVPMALATGRGAEVQRPLATVVIGGLVTSTLLTLLVLPALYRMFEPERESEPATD